MSFFVQTFWMGTWVDCSFGLQTVEEAVAYRTGEGPGVYRIVKRTEEVVEQG